MSLHSCLYLGNVVHRRLRPKTHVLRYRVFWLLVDLDEIEKLAGRFWLFSHNRFNAISFYDDDHGSAGGQLRAQVEGLVRAAQLPGGGPIMLLTMPRIFNYVFNPLSVYFCHDPNGTLSAIVYEVHNTFGERHWYVLPATSENGHIDHETDKAFYVSPFLDMKMRYAFRVFPPAHNVRVAIRGFDSLGGIISTALNGQRQELTDFALLMALLKFPFLTLKVTAAIHWHALLLWLKGIRVRAHQPRPAQ
ncbi:DUF1365 domain-containing protein [Hyphomicrobium sp.]|uniref:DUF1365 domain-containing protein n=1 Tax=Hyphomicrobium sp. TaxID=82 RepID=UPI000FB72DEF|nr:DUF1365 domain-containing protein [Hyphomicrobium sp.]RUP00599.1 MAG: DUF1365 domain-containing protein [Hyphomicrobium sp.]